MTEYPFTVTIEPTEGSSKPESVLCVELLRRLGASRKVLSGMWDNRAVIVKIFSDPLKAKYHLKREWRGLKLLSKRGLSSPPPLFCGRVKPSGWAVVTERILDARDARKLWDLAADPQVKRELLCRLSRELAIHHSKGVIQRDLHLGNFLLKGEKTFILDPAQIRFLAGEVGRGRSIAQLAALISIIPEEDSDTIRSVCEEYARMRGWEFSEADKAQLRKKLLHFRNKGVRNTLKKCLHTNKRYERFKHNKCFGVAERGFFEKAGFAGLIARIDNLMETGQVLKKGNTCFVSRIRWADQDIVIKRYNHKGLIHSLRQTIMRSRARRCWLHAHRLRALDIPTPRPLAYIERRSGPIVWQSYFITDYVEASRLSEFLNNAGTSETERAEMLGRLRQLLDKMGKYGITHGDLKHTNILISGTGPVLTDLDGTNVHKYKWNWLIQKKTNKELKRLCETIET